MGQVYLARTPAGRALALKTVRAEFGLDPGFGERFAREISHADRVRSPWTVAVVDFSPAGSRPPWLATEYVAAPSLSDWVAAHGPLPEPAVAALAAELCEALRAVHQAGLTHRDVKPSNVLLARQRPQLIDFGIARAAEDSRHTRTGGMIGSPGFMAPEQATAGVSAEPGDLFAMGAVLVYAATGHGPFSRPGEEPSTPALLYRVVHEDADLTGLPDALAPLVRACLAKEPQDRPTAQDAAALLQEAGVRAGSWPKVPPPGFAEDLAAREAEAAAVLGEPVADALGASPYAPTAPVTVSGPPSGPGQAAAQLVPHTPVPPVWGQGQPRGPHGGAGPAYGTPPRRRTGPLIALAALGVVAVLIVIGVLVDRNKPDGSGRSGPDSPGPTSASATALPAAWVGTWTGTGPGSPDGADGTRTDRFTVTLTLNPGARGSVLGKDVSDVREVGTGRNVGCTEALRLSEVRGASMVFEAVTSHPTDRTYGGTCPKGNIYVVTMTDARTLRLGDEGAQSNGAPATFTKTG